MIYKILCIGNQWRGSDDGSLFRAFSRAGHLIDVVDDRHFVPSEVFSMRTRLIRRISHGWFEKDFNNHLLKRFKAFEPDLVFVYKGATLNVTSILEIKKRNVPIVCIYPDVSFFDHGSNIPQLIPHYDHIFMTKRFGIEDLKTKFNFSKASFIHHSIDPEIHRIIAHQKANIQGFICDASFIGSYSYKKESILKDLLQYSNSIDLKIWGYSWQHSRNEEVLKRWEGQPVVGDLYALAIQNSKINISILSEAGKHSSRGDQITSRTFHIPGCGGFMIHERTQEFSELFEEGKHAECFADAAELAEKLNFYLDHPEKRDKIALAGMQFVYDNHTSDHRASQILDELKICGLLTYKAN